LPVTSFFLVGILEFAFAPGFDELGPGDGVEEVIRVGLPDIIKLISLFLDRVPEVHTAVHWHGSDPVLHVFPVEVPLCDGEVVVGDREVDKCFLELFNGGPGIDDRLGEQQGVGSHDLDERVVVTLQGIRDCIACCSEPKCAEVDDIAFFRHEGEIAVEVGNCPATCFPDNDIAIGDRLEVVGGDYNAGELDQVMVAALRNCLEYRGVE